VDFRVMFHLFLSSVRDFTVTETFVWSFTTH